MALFVIYFYLHSDVVLNLHQFHQSYLSFCKVGLMCCSSGVFGFRWMLMRLAQSLLVVRDALL